MTGAKKTARVLEDLKVNVRIRLAALWVTLILIYIYVDIISFYKPGTIPDILSGKVWGLDISQSWAMGALLLMTIPSLMVILSMTLKAGVNRWVNIIVAILYIAVGIGNSIGETWAFFIVGHAIGIVLLLWTIWTAWRWPKEEA